MTTPLYVLRCLQAGLRIEDLDLIDMGLAIDILSESANDDAEYPRKATQEDFDNF